VNFPDIPTIRNIDVTQNRRHRQWRPSCKGISCRLQLTGSNTPSLRARAAKRRAALSAADSAAADVVRCSMQKHGVANSSCSRTDGAPPVASRQAFSRSSSRQIPAAGKLRRRYRPLPLIAHWRVPLTISVMGAVCSAQSVLAGYRNCCSPRQLAGNRFDLRQQRIALFKDCSRYHRQPGVAGGQRRDRRRIFCCRSSDRYASSRKTRSFARSSR
jgi:hypothetical protein